MPIGYENALQGQSNMESKVYEQEKRKERDRRGEKKNKNKIKHTSKEAADIGPRGLARYFNRRELWRHLDVEKPHLITRRNKPTTKEKNH